MSKEVKIISAVVTIIIVGIIGIIIANKLIGKNNVQDFQIVQSISGNVRVQSQGGYYFKFFDTVWTYPKTASIFFSNKKDESKDNDGVVVRFKNKGGGTISCQIVTRYFTDDISMKKLHEYCGGDIEKLDNIILARIKEHASNEAAKIDSSAAIENRELFANNIRAKLISDKELKDRGIILESFAITSIDFDNITDKLFEAQRNADLQKKTAEAEKAKYMQEKEKEVAKYETEIATSKGKAEVEKIKAVTDAERQKELAEIQAKQKVAVAELEKQQATIEANKKLEIAEIQKKEENARLEVIKIQAEQKIAEAKAKEQQIKLSGAITESERIKLEYEMNTKVNVAKAWANGISSMKLPETIIFGGGNSANPVDTFFNLMNVQKVKEINKTK